MVDPKSKIVLVVDDDADLREAITYDFKRTGYQTLQAANGRVAFDLIEKTHVDLVVSDVKMPGGDGRELLDRIRIRNVDLPILMFITGFSDFSIEEAYQRGANALFTKPYNRKLFMAAVQRVLTPREERWKARVNRIEVDLKVDVLIGNENLKEARVVNLGQGGIFIGYSGVMPDVESTVAFKLTSTFGAGAMMRGSGIVRWVRNEPIEAYPRGFGLEFAGLDDSTCSEILRVLEQTKPIAFIPKS
jgi:two-component system response regulator (stage 0 sporulation protein F)